MFFNKSRQVLTVSIIDELITFCYWSIEDKKIIFKDLHKYKIKDYEIVNLLIFNFTKIEQIIEEFLHKNKLNAADIYLSLNGNAIEESLIFKNSKINEFKDNVNYNQICLNKEKEMYYVVGIEHALICQYQLLFIKLNLNLVKISTDLISLISIQNLDAKKDLTIGDFKKNIENSINFDFEKYITNKSEIIDLDRKELITSIGLFF